MDNDQAYNNEVKNWGKGTLKNIQDRGDQENIQHRKSSKSKGSSIKAIRENYGNVNGEIKRISFKIRRHLVYVVKGVGKETPIAKAGTTNRKAKDFLNEPIDANIEALADIVAEHTGNTISNNILIQ